MHKNHSYFLTVDSVPNTLVKVSTFYLTESIDNYLLENTEKINVILEKVYDFSCSYTINTV